MAGIDVIEAVATLIDDATARLPDRWSAQLGDLAARLREPVRVAVVGPVKSGKSTMVNALLGQRVAPTDVSECTQVVAWFRYGHPQRVEVHRKDGTIEATQLEADGTLPRTLPAPPGDIESIQCYLANDALRDLTLIDTPGLGSVHAGYSQATVDLLQVGQDSASAVSGADAVVFLFSQVMMADDYQALRGFGVGSTSAANAVGVLSRADQLGGDVDDPWQVAVELAATYAVRFKQDVAAVVPVVGLLAETAETAGIVETDVGSLRSLAAMDPKAFDRLVWSADRFVSAEAPVDIAQRERLLALLDLWGVTRAVDDVRAGADGAVALRRILSSLSGIEGVKRSLGASFRQQDQVLKARSALDVLEGITYQPAADGSEGAALLAVRDDVERLRLDPAAHPVAELEAWHAVATGKIPLPEARVEEIRHLFAPGTTAARLGLADADADGQRRAVRDALVSWQRFLVTDATPTQAQVARVVRRSYQLMWTALQ